MNFTDFIPNIVRGFEIKKDWVVLLNFWGENCDLEILDKFTLEVAKAGGVPVRWQQSRELTKAYFTEVPEGNLSFPDKYFEIFKLADAVVDIFMYSAAPHKDFPKDRFPLYGAYMRKLFNALTEGKELFIQVRVPTEENAEGEDIDYEIYREAMLSALSVDIIELKKECAGLVNKLMGKNRVDIYTGNNSVLAFNLEGRQWYKDDGTGDVPPGEVYIAPVEESAEGEILIPEVILEGKKLSNVYLKFKAGKLMGCSSEELMVFIKGFPGDSSMIAEFGMGLNDNVKKPTGCTLIDEKSKGTAHIAVGMNNLFGGRNSSPLHMDFVFTPVKIEVDGTLLMNGSKIVL